MTATALIDLATYFEFLDELSAEGKKPKPRSLIDEFSMSPKKARATLLAWQQTLTRAPTSYKRAELAAQSAPK